MHTLFSWRAGLRVRIRLRVRVRVRVRVRAGVGVVRSSGSQYAAAGTDPPWPPLLKGGKLGATQPEGNYRSSDREFSTGQGQRPAEHLGRRRGQRPAPNAFGKTAGSRPAPNASEDGGVGDLRRTLLGRRRGRRPAPNSILSCGGSRCGDLRSGRRRGERPAPNASGKTAGSETPPNTSEDGGVGVGC